MSVLFLYSEGSAPAPFCVDVCNGMDIACVTYNSFMKLYVALTNPRAQPSTVYYTFCVRVDKFSKLTIRNSYKFYQGSHGSYIQVFAGINDLNNVIAKYTYNNTEHEKRYLFGLDTERQAAYFQLIINLSGGFFPLNTTEIQYDTSCDVNGRCLLDFNQFCVNNLDCGAPVNDKNIVNDIKLFVVFQGTDARGAPLTSNSFTPTKFRSFSTNNILNELIYNRTLINGTI